MDRKNAKALLPIIKAYADGKSIEVRNHNIDDDKWKETDYPSFEPSFDYRIKPKVKYRPFKNADECWNEMLKHEPFGWIKSIDAEPWYEHITIVMGTRVQSDACNGKIEPISYKEAIDEYTFPDGTPFGIKEGGEE